MIMTNWYIPFIAIPACSYVTNSPFLSLWDRIQLIREKVNVIQVSTQNTLVDQVLGCIE
jgi:hypothetical protein